MKLDGGGPGGGISRGNLKQFKVPNSSAAAGLGSGGRRGGGGAAVDSLLVWPHSYTCVPRPSVLYPKCPAVVELIRYDDALEILHALVAQLGFYSEAQGGAVADR